MSNSEQNLFKFDSDDLNLSFSYLWSSLKKISTAYQELSKQFLDLKSKNEAFESHYSHEIENSKQFVDRIKILEQKNYELNEMVDSFKRRNEDYNQEILDLKKYRNDYELVNTSFEDLVAQYEKLKSELSQFENLENEYNNEKELNKKLSELNESYLSKLSTLENENIDFSFAQKEIIRKNHELNEKNDELIRYKNRIAELESIELENKALKADRNHLINKVADLETQLNESATSYSKFNELLEKEKANFDQQLNSIIKERDEINEIKLIQDKTIEDYSGQNLNLRLEISSYEKKINAHEDLLKKSITDLENTAKERDSIASQYADYESLKASISSLELDLNDKKQSYQDLFTKYLSLETSVYDYLAEIEKLQEFEKENQILKGNIDKINQELLDSKNEHIELLSKNKDLENKISDLKIETELISEELQKKETELNRIISERNENSIFNIDLNDKIKELETICRSLKNELTQSQNNLAQARIDNEDIVQISKKREFKINELENLVLELKNDLDLKTNEYNDISEKLLQSEIESRQNENMAESTFTKTTELEEDLKITKMNLDLVEAKLNDCQSQLSDLHLKYVEEHSKAINYSINYSNIESELNEKTLEIEKLKKVIFDYAAQLQLKNNELDEIILRIEDFVRNDRSKELSEEINVLETYLSRKDEEIHQLKELLNDKSKDELIARLNEKVNSLVQTIDNKALELEKYSGLNEKHQSLEMQYNNLQKQKEIIDEECKIKESQITVLLEKIEFIKTNDKSDEHNLAIKNLTAYSDELQFELRLLNEEKELLKSQLNDFKIRNFEIEEKLLNSDDLLKEKDFKISKLDSEITNLNQLLNQETEKRKRLLNKIDAKIIELEKSL
jgi:chromosome segregation ATPase